MANKIKDKDEDEISLEVFFAYSKKIYTPESFWVLFFPPKKLARLFLLTEVKPSPDHKMIKLLPFDNLFPSLQQFG